MQVREGARSSGRTSYIIEEFLRDPKATLIIAPSEDAAVHIRSRLADWGLDKALAERNVKSYRSFSLRGSFDPKSFRVLADDYDLMDARAFQFPIEWINVATVEGNTGDWREYHSPTGLAKDDDAG